MAAFTPVGVIAVVDGLGKFNSDLRSMDRSIQKTGDSAKRSTGKFKSFATGLGSVAAVAGTAVVAGLGAAVVGIVGFSASATQAAISYESAFTGVLKTTDGLVDATGQLNSAGEELRRGFIDLSKEIPITPEALASIGELGGQLGISRENLLSFTETIAQLGVTTNLSTEEAAVGFAQLANIMGTSQDLFDNLGSATVALGNNFATTERDIVNFASRMAGAAAIAGLTEADVLGIGAAFSSIGVQAEAGGTAVQKVLLGINTAIATGSDQVAIFANTAGLSAQEFANLWETDASEAFRLFVEGLGRQGDDAILTLEELGLTDQRLIRSFLSLAGAGDLLGQALATSNQAFAENTALTKEAETRFATTESQIQLLKNTFFALKEAVGRGILPVLNKLIGVLKRLVDENQDRIVAFFESIRAFVAEKLPPAIQTLSNLWNSTLLPAFQQVSAFIQKDVLPTLGTIVSFLAENLPTAVRFVSTIWLTALKPAFLLVSGIIRELVLPAIQGVALFLQENLPTAIATASEFWNTTLLPIFEKTASFVTETVIPAFGELRTFLQEKIPIAVEAAGRVWDETLRPAIEGVQKVIQNLLLFWEENGPGLQETAEKIFSAVGEIVGSVTEIITELAAEIIPFLVEQFVKISEWWVENGPIVEGLVKKAGEVFAELGIVVERLGKAIAGEAFAELGAAVERFGIVVEGVWKTIEPILDSIVNAVLGLGEVILEVADGDWKGAWETIKDVASENMQNTQEAAETGLETISDVFKTSMDELERTWGTSWESVKTAVETKWEEIKTAISTAIDNVKGFFAEADWEQIGFDVMTALIRGVKSLITDIETTFSTAVEAWETLIFDTDWAAVGQDIITFLLDGLTAISDVIERLTTMAKDGAKAISEFDWASAGKDIIDGIVKGINDAKNSVLNAIRGIAKGALDAIKAELGISSPSRVFFDIGQDIVNGLIRGMVSRREEVDSVVEGLIDLGKIGTTITGTFEGLEESERGTAKFIEAQKDLLDFIRQQGLKLSDFVDPDQFFDLTTADLADIGRQVTQSVNRALEVQLRGQVFFGDFLAGIEDQLDPVKDIIGDVRNLARGVGGLGRFVELEQLQAIEDRFKEIQLAQERLLMAEPNSSLAKFYQLFLSGLTGELVQNVNALADTQQRLLSIQAKQSQLDFLKEQQKILDTIAREGLDPSAILQGITLGLDANINDLLAVQERLLEALIAQANQTLGISSPSKVFSEMGQRIMQGLTTGVVSAMKLPQKAINQATDLMASQQAISAPNIMTTNNAVNITNTVRDNLDLAIIDSQINRALGEA